MEEIITALNLQNYYAVAALILLLAIQFVRKTPGLSVYWRSIPEGFRWLVPVVSGAVAGFVNAFQAGADLPTALMSALGGALAISLPAMGANALLTDSPIPWNGRAGGKGG